MQAGNTGGGATVSGSISVNGEECSGQKMRRISGFVHQVGRAVVKACALVEVLMALRLRSASPPMEGRSHRAAALSLLPYLRKMSSSTR